MEKIKQTWYTNAETKIVNNNKCLWNAFCNTQSELKKDKLTLSRKSKKKKKLKALGEFNWFK